MAPELVVDPDVPPPARLSGYLLHTPRRELSGALFAAATLALAVIGLRDFPLITEAVSDRLLLGAVTLALPPLLVATLAANLAWSLRRQIFKES